MGPLVDTSVLIDYFGGYQTAEATTLDALLADGAQPATAPIVVQEFLQGFTRERDATRAASYVSLFEPLSPPTYATHRRAAALHVSMKRAGFPCPTVDTLIVAIAEEAGRALLTSDEHQRRLARAVGVELATQRRQ